MIHLQKFSYKDDRHIIVYDNNNLEITYMFNNG